MLNKKLLKMLDGKSLKNAVIAATALMGKIFLLPASVFAASCPAVISGTALSGEICDFDATNNITIANGGTVGGINQNGYNPTSSYITNNGTVYNDGIISEDTYIAINIVNSSLTNGITNNGSIRAVYDSALLINTSSTVSGGVSNTGTIISERDMALRLDNNSTINGNISNSGSIISNSINNPALIVRNNSVVNGDINNSGVIRSAADGNAILLSGNTGAIEINGSIINSGSIRANGSAIAINWTNISGDITNSGTITSDGGDGINIMNSVTLDGNIINSGTISGHNNGIAIDTTLNTVNGIVNQLGGTITGNNSGIYVNDESTVTSDIKNYGTVTGNYGIYVADSTITDGIKNYGTISGDSIAIYIATSTVGSITTYDGSVINGIIEAANTDLNINGGTINGSINASTVNIGSGVTFNMAHTITAGSGVTNAGNLVLETSQTIAGNYSQLTSGILKINAQDTTSYGKLNVIGNVDLTQSGAIDVNVVSGANIVAGNTLSNVISGTTLTTPTGGFSVTDNSRLLNFIASLNNTNNGVNLVAADDAGTSITQSNAAVGNRGGNGAAAKLDEIIASNTSGDWQNVTGAFNKLSSDQQIADAVNQTTPALTGATNSAIIETMATALRIVQERQQSNSGVAAGEDFKTDNNLWMKTFGSWGKQDNKDGVIGYNSNSYGLITGTDKAIDNKTRLGVAASYFNSKLTSNGDNNRVNVDSFLGILYGSHKLDEKTEVNAQVAAGYNSSNSTRYINFGGLSRTAKGSYDGWNFHAGTGISRLVNLDSYTTISPQFRVDYFNVGNQGYNESGAGALSLQVASQTQAQLIPALEVRADHKFAAKFSFSLNGGLGYDLLHERNNVSASFIDGGGEFATRGLAASPWVVRSGAGVTWRKSEVVDLTARYDRRDRGGYNNQTLSLKLRVMF